MNRKLPPLLALRVFECVARHGSFTKAADELCVTQAAVSHQIKALEDWIGAPLFRRLSRNIKLTEIGEKLAQPLGGAFDLIADGTEAALSQDKVQPITVAVFDSFASAWIVPRLARFRERFPDIQVKFVAKRQEDDALSTGKADIEIRYGDGNWPNLRVEKIMDETILPVCAPALLEMHGHPQALSDIARYPLLHDVFIVDWKEFLGHFDLPQLRLSGGFGFSHSHLVKRACLEGLGIALGRWPLIAEEIESGALVRPFDCTLKLDNAYYVSCRNDVADEGEIKAFAYWLLDEADRFRELHGAEPPAWDAPFSA